jgi:hypothetical protein
VKAPLRTCLERPITQVPGSQVPTEAKVSAGEVLERTVTMTKGIVVLIGVVLVVLAVLSRALTAQQTQQPAAVVMTNSGLQVEEVFVGRSCVVLVTRRGSSASLVVGEPLAVPCTR